MYPTQYVGEYFRAQPRREAAAYPSLTTCNGVILLICICVSPGLRRHWDIFRRRRRSHTLNPHVVSGTMDAQQSWEDLTTPANVNTGQKQKRKNCVMHCNADTCTWKRSVAELAWEAHVGATWEYQVYSLREVASPWQKRYDDMIVHS